MRTDEIRGWFDLGMPGAFVANYGFLLREHGPNRRTPLMRSTVRLIRAYEAAKAELVALEAIRGRSVWLWFKKRQEAAKIADRMKKIGSDLVDWVTKTLRYFCKTDKLQGKQSNEYL